MVINRFRGEHDFLSNFFYAPVGYRGYTYITSEHAYQAARAGNKEDHDYVARAPTAAMAKRRGHEIRTRADWDDIKLLIMKEIVKAKFNQHPMLKVRLMATAPERLEEGNDWEDRYWGTVNGEGDNYLGKILMMLRDSYIEQELEDMGDR
jgi:ribA/ribD-fused uncharacterized protein